MSDILEKIGKIEERQELQMEKIEAQEKETLKLHTTMLNMQSLMNSDPKQRL